MKVVTSGKTVGVLNKMNKENPREQRRDESLCLYQNTLWNEYFDLESYHRKILADKFTKSYIQILSWNMTFIITDCHIFPSQ